MDKSSHQDGDGAGNETGGDEDNDEWDRGDTRGLESDDPKDPDYQQSLEAEAESTDASTYALGSEEGSVFG